MFPSSASSTRFIKIILALSDYPILGKRIRERMRQELFDQDIISPRVFEAKVREMALRTQQNEGLTDPFAEEQNQTWEVRLERIREHLTELIFSQNLSFEVFEEMVNAVLSEERGVEPGDLFLNINFELAPMELVFEYARHVESLPPAERVRFSARYQEAKVVLIRTLISDQLRYIKIARDYLTIDDLAQIREHKIGAGRIGGKAAGMHLAAAIAASTGSKELRDCIRIPDSYYIGSGELYTFIAYNDLIKWNTQKYKSEEEMRAEYPQIIAEFEQGSMPEDILSKLSFLLESTERKPLIVRSSSLLEDNFGTSFAGKYESIFLPNQGTLEENLNELVKAMGRIYASTLNPSALLYRRSKGLVDYDERMALLIQVVEGEQFGNYYLPHGAGVAFSRNMYRWTPSIRREDGFVRLVWGLGTRAVDRVGNDYPRLIALSHPSLRPSTDPKSIRHYSQQYVDLIDLDTNQIRTLPVHDVINSRYQPLRYIAQIDEGGYFSSLRSNLIGDRLDDVVITFDELLRRTSFAARMRELLHILENRYASPVDMEFTFHLDRLESGELELQITLLQCRPQSHMDIMDAPPIPEKIPAEDLIFSTSFVVPQGYLPHIEYIVYISPKEYFSLPTLNDRFELGQAIGRLNEQLVGEDFIMIGPGRWGSSNSDLGVPIIYGDIFNSKALIELTGPGIGAAPEPSLGTHFFQDLMEANIYPLAIDLNDPRTIFHPQQLENLPNHLLEFGLNDQRFESCLRLIRVSDLRQNHTLRIIMNDEKGVAVAYLVPSPQANTI